MAIAETLWFGYVVMMSLYHSLHLQFSCGIHSQCAPPSCRVASYPNPPLFKFSFEEDASHLLIVLASNPNLVEPDERPSMLKMKFSSINVLVIVIILISYLSPKTNACN